MSIAKMYLSTWVTLVLVGTALGETGPNPGIQSKITQKALEYAKQIAITDAEKKMMAFQPPDLSGTIDLLGWMKYRITGMYIKSFGLPNSDIGFVPNSGIKFSIDNAHIDIAGKWHVTFGLIKDGGTFELNINNLAATFVVNVSQDNARPVLSYEDCSAKLNSFELHLHGGGSWFYNMFLAQVKDKIRYIAPQKLCWEFKNIIGKLETFIQRLKISKQLDKYVELDYSLVAEMEITTNSIDFPIKGELYDVQHHLESPFTARSFHLPNSTNHMFILGLSEYFVNTGGFAYFAAGAFHLNITDDMVPKDIPFRLNTSDLAHFIPKVAQLYPNLLMKVVMSASKQPIVRLVPGKLRADVFVATEVFAILPNKSVADLFVLGITVSMCGQIFTSDMRVHGSVSLNSMHLTVEESKVGGIPTQVMENMLKLGLRMMVIPKINAKLKKGFIIPTLDKVSLIDPVLKIEQGLILITTDLQYGN